MDFPTSVRQCTEPIVSAAVEIYGRMSTDLLPTPAKSHYVFNLRDLSKCIQGNYVRYTFMMTVVMYFFVKQQNRRFCFTSIVEILGDVYFVFSTVSILNMLNVVISGILQADTGVIRDNKQMFRLFCHESMRVFHDRLINKEDKGFFYTILSEMAGKHFSEVKHAFSSVITSTVLSDNFE